MKDIKVVIGANFGDEGKGLMTDYFASKAPEGLVVRFNGGAQAGHTVTTPDGKRHIFGHFGSGTLAGLPTFLSKFFVVNPLLFAQEYKTLENLGVKPSIYIDENCLVTTPYDMMINQIVEAHRGEARHGSCGVGFNETIERCSRQKYKMRVRDLLAQEWIVIIKQIQQEYVPMRLKELGITDIPGDFARYIASDIIFDKYLQDIRSMLSLCTLTKSEVISQYNSIIFEGAQGLLLDQDSGYFPHVTRSNTGMKNVVELLKETNLQDESLEIVYVTRAYMTRHGAGPFASEVEGKPYEGIVDATNVPNAFQGTLRFGILDIDLLVKSMKKDLEYADGLKYKYKVAISCLDQVGDDISFLLRGKKKTGDIHTLLARIWAMEGPFYSYVSYGPTRETIKEM